MRNRPAAPALSSHHPAPSAAIAGAARPSSSPDGPTPGGSGRGERLLARKFFLTEVRALLIWARCGLSCPCAFGVHWETEHLPEVSTPPDVGWERTSSACACLLPNGGSSPGGVFILSFESPTDQHSYSRGAFSGIFFVLFFETEVNIFKCEKALTGWSLTGQLTG